MPSFFQQFLKAVSLLMVGLFSFLPQTIQNYLTGIVLPSLRDHHNEFLLKEMKRRWENHKIMNEWMRKFFMYLVRGSPYHVLFPFLPLPPAHGGTL